MYNDILWIPQRDRVGPGYEFMDDLQPPMCYQDCFIFPNLTRPYMPPLQYHHDSLDTSHTGPDWNLVPYTPIVTPTSAPKTPTKASPASPTKHHPDFSTREYLGLANAVITINPFGVKHGQKGAKWKEVSKALKAEKLFPKSSTDTIKNKMIALLKYHKDPDSAIGSKIAREMSSTVGISIAVLLNRASKQKRVADHQTEDQKDKTRVKDEKDHKGDVENDNLNPNNCHLKRQKKASMSGMCEMQEMMKESESQRGKFEGKIVEALQESTRVYETAQKNFLDVLKDKLN